MTDQTTLNGDKIEAPDCEMCDNEATRIFELRGMSENEVHACDDCKPEWRGKGGIESVRELKPEEIT